MADLFGEAKRKQHARYIRQLAKGPRGQWTRRDVTNAEKAAFLGREPSGAFRLVTHGFRNNHFAVWVSEESSEWGPIVHLWIRRHDSEPVRSWAELQRIKNELAGSERTAIEVFPSESDLVDQANMYHLWVMPEGFRLPFGLRGNHG